MSIYLITLPEKPLSKTTCGDKRFAIGPRVCLHRCEDENACMRKSVCATERESTGKEARSGNLNNTCELSLATNSVFCVCQQTLWAKYGHLTVDCNRLNVTATKPSNTYECKSINTLELNA